MVASGSHGDYPQAILELAAEMQVPVIDLHQKARFSLAGTCRHKTSLSMAGKGEHPNYPDGKRIIPTSAVRRGRNRQACG